MFSLKRLTIFLISASLAITASATDALSLSVKLAKMRQSVWAAWCKDISKSSDVAILPFNALEDSTVTAWNIPETLEPNATMNFITGTKGVEPATGYPAYLYLHGSGPRAEEWATGLKLAKYFNDSPSAYIIPEIPNEGKFYRWWQQGKQWCWKRVFQQLLASKDVDPSRLYIFGISEGGYGSQRLASYYADYLAAAGPMAGGEPLKNAPTENLSNIAFNFRTGEKDGMFFRHYLTQLTGKSLDSLETRYPSLFHHHVELIPGKGHHIDYSQTTPWLSRHQRNAQPQHFLWENMEMDSVKRDNFYNLEVLKETDAYRTMYEFSAHDNRVDITVNRVEYTTTWIDPYWNIDMVFSRTFKPAESGDLRVYLSENLVDLTQPVTIAVNGTVRFSGMLNVSKATMKQAVKLWGDPLRLFPAMVEVKW